MSFKISSDKKPNGDQPKAIKFLTDNINLKNQVLMGVTGSGKTFTIANVIQNVQKPTLVICPNKTLAAQFFAEMKDLFPENAVEYFVSYYDFYQPESYIARTDTYIEKEATINEQIDVMRHSATQALFERRDVVVVSSVSCIYGLGVPKNYFESRRKIGVGEKVDINELAKELVSIRYQRNNITLERGCFRIQGDTFEIFPSQFENKAWRLSLFGNDVDQIEEINPRTGQRICKIKEISIYPNTHYLANDATIKIMCDQIMEELKERIQYFDENDKLIEKQRIRERVLYDIEMLKNTGTCRGIENYARYLAQKNPGDPPDTLFDYLPSDALLVVDESHVTVPQINGMYNGNKSRKLSLSEYGFRLPSCLDNRPLKFEEWGRMRPNTIFVSATPGEWEVTESRGAIVEQIIRPTGLLDPEIVIRPIKTQVDELIGYIQDNIKSGLRVLVITLTKKMAEYLSEYLIENGIKAKYLHSDVETLERVEIITGLRTGEFDVLIGINLLREGVDIPECGLVAILEADKEGFLRSRTSLIQTIGRAARNKAGKVILFADQITDSIKYAVEETERRRKIQEEYNTKHGIVPENIKKSLNSFMTINNTSQKTLEELEAEMEQYAKSLEFEKAAKVRDMINKYKKKLKI